jgi:hypothetical protein
MPLILPGNVGSATAATGFNVDNSCKFDYASSDHVHKTPGSAGSGTKFVFSTWIKRTKLATAMNIIYAQTATNNYERIRFVDTDKIEISGVANGSTAYNFSTNAVYRDPSAWMHLHVIRDSTQGTASNRLKVYVNGVLQTLAQDTALGENYSGLITGANVHRIAVGNGEPLGAYLAEVILLDGQVITPDGNTGEFDDDSGIWKPLDVSELTFGTTGFYLDFEASDNLGNDANGGTDLTETNLAAVDQATDTCTNNFATLNPLVPSQGGFTPGSATYTEGATLFTTVNASSSYSRANSTILLTTGKWYVEIKYVNAGSIFGLVGITGSNATAVAAYPGVYAYDYAWYGNGGFSSGDGNFYNNNGIVRELGSGFDNNDILGMAIDLDNNTIQYYRAGSAVGSANAIAAPSATDFGGYVVCAGEWSNSSNAVFNFNFGNPPYANSSDAADGNGFGAFEYAPPSGFLAICTKNLSTVNS